MRPKDYPSKHKELWQKFVNLEPKPRPYDYEEPAGALFWTVVCTVVAAAVVAAWLWYGPEPLTKIFPTLRG